MIGAIAGDIIGSVYEVRPIKTKDFELFHPSCRFTDDSVATVAIADAILKVRAGSVRVVPGYDGVYGKLVLEVGGSEEKPIGGRVQQLNLADFW